MVAESDIPESAYGIKLEDYFETELDEVVEEVKRVGYAILDSGFSPEYLGTISSDFDSAWQNYVSANGGATRLKKLNEFYTVRALLTHGGTSFLNLATAPKLMTVIHKLIAGKFILNQQNGIINPPQETYNQALWHRDLPYQHYVSSTPLAINALFCIDDFNADNGATYVLPASHKSSNLPTKNYRKKHALQIEAKAGSFILLDSMIFHSGGLNRTNKARRAVNHVYTIPYFKQQIKILQNMSSAPLSIAQKELLGFNLEEPASIEIFLNQRAQKAHN